jgi:hypothetical protein
MEIVIIRPFTGAPGGVEISFSAGQKIAVPDGITRKYADMLVRKKLAEWATRKNKRKDSGNGTESVQD